MQKEELNPIELVALGKNPLEMADNLLRAVEYIKKTAKSHTERTKLVKFLFEQFAVQVRCSHFSKLSPENKNHPSWLVVGGETHYSCCEMFGRLGPQYESPVKTMREIERFAYELKGQFFNIPTKHLSMDKANAVMKYMDSNWDFSNRVLSENFPTHIVAINGYNAETTTELYTFSMPESDQYTYIAILYGYEDAKDLEEKEMESDLISCLGQMVFFSCIKKNGDIPKDLLDLLSESFFPEIKSLTEFEQESILVDVFAMGLGLDCPYGDSNRYSVVDLDAKKLFREITKKVMDLPTILHSFSEAASIYRKASLVQESTSPFMAPPARFPWHKNIMS